jgi:hypothetical protein
MKRASTVVVAFVAFQLVGAAQQTVPFDGGIPVAPAGFEPGPIPAEPIEFDTAEVMRIRVVPDRAAHGESVEPRLPS